MALDTRRKSILPSCDRHLARALKPPPPPFRDLHQAQEMIWSTLFPLQCPDFPRHILGRTSPPGAPKMLVPAPTERPFLRVLKPRFVYSGLGTNSTVADMLMCLSPGVASSLLAQVALRACCRNEIIIICRMSTLETQHDSLHSCCLEYLNLHARRERERKGKPETAERDNGQMHYII